MEKLCSSDRSTDFDHTTGCSFQKAIIYVIVTYESDKLAGWKRNLAIVFLQHCNKDSQFSEIRPNTTVWSLTDVSNQRKRLIFKVRNAHQSPLHGEAASDPKRKKKCSYYFVERKATKQGINKRGKERFTTCKKKKITHLLHV